MGRNATHWIEPLWKQALSHKGLLAALSECYPRHRLLIPASMNPGDLRDPLPKPFFGREGEGMQRGSAPHDGVCYQEWMPLVQHEGFHPVIGSWVINGHAAGMGIRETTGLITDTTAQFVPHVIDSPAPSAAEISTWMRDE